MNNASRRTFRRLGGLAVLVGLAAAIVLVPSALSVSTSRTFTASATTSVAPGKNGASLTFTINNTGSVTLDSADITLPSGFANATVQPLTAPATSAVDANGVVQLRNLGLGGGSSVTASITADAPCTGAGSWSVTAKAANGQAFTLVGSAPSTSLTGNQCTLAFTSQPNNANFNTTITSTAYDPAGNAVAVQALNGDNVQAHAATDLVTVVKSAGFFTSTGSGFKNNSGQLSGGSVSFPSLQSSQTGLDLQLTATATGYTSSSASSVFDISVDGKKCAADTCNANASGVHTSVSASGAQTTNTNVGVGLLDFSVFSIPANVCSSGAFSPIPGSQGFTQSIQEPAGNPTHPDYTITVVFDKTIANAIPQNGVSSIQACLLAKRVDPTTGLPTSCSLDKSNGLTGFPTANDPNGDLTFRAACDTSNGPTAGYWEGLMPNAGPGINSCTDPRLTGPAVLSRNRNTGSGPANVQITFCKPSVDVADASLDGDWDGAGGFH